jgi:hypothetical protein
MWKALGLFWHFLKAIFSLDDAAEEPFVFYGSKGGYKCLIN